ncbi:MAG: NAD-dependent epimerase/dehydratase family protein [Promethearchaeia archaeon]
MSSEDSKFFLVDGAKGHTGTFLLKALLDHYPTCKIIATDLPLESRKELMSKEKIFSEKLGYMLEILEDPRINFIPADLTDPHSLEALFENRMYDTIFHPASLYDYFAELDILREINVKGTENLLEMICKTQDLEKLRFIHWSTCGVYGEPEYEYGKDGYVIPADEDTPYNPPNYYSISKKEQELILKDFIEKYNLKATIIRPAPIYGPYQTYGTYHILLMLRVLGTGIVPLLFPKKRRLMLPSIHVEDLVEAAIFLATKEEAIEEEYNIIHDMVWTDEWLEWIYERLSIRTSIIPLWFPLFKIFAKIAGWLADLRIKKSRKLDVRPLLDSPMVKYITHQYAFSNEKLKLLGYEFKYNTWSGFAQTIKWYYDHDWLPTETNQIEVY